MEQPRLDPIDAYAPWSSKNERRLRARLYNGRDIAGAHAARTTGSTHMVFKAAEELATDFVWRRSSDDELRTVANAVVRLIQAGTELEQGEVTDA